MNAFEDTAVPVREGERLDNQKLEAYLTAQMTDVTGPLVVEQFPQGYSNLTYLLRMGNDEWVLRRPPFGNRVKSAHCMGREYRVLSRLSTIYELAPRTVLYCDDEDVLGAPFYVMQRIRGIVLRKQLPAGLNLDDRTARRLSEAFIDNLARLHTLDYEAAGLADLGKPAGYVERQVSGWTKRYESARTADIREMDRVVQWLKDHQPSESGHALIHNDYKYDNMVLDNEKITRILAVLDWEMCTLGDPLMDLGCTLSYWVEAGDDDALKQFLHGPTYLPGSMNRRELAARYAERTGSDTSNMLFYYCFGLFRLAVIIQQIFARYARGHTTDSRFARLDIVVANLARAASASIERGSM